LVTPMDPVKVADGDGADSLCRFKVLLDDHNRCILNEIILNRF
jgi:hypothetical protein